MTEPPRMPQIERLLSDSVRRLSTNDAEAAFNELLNKYKKQRPLWHKKLLLSLSELQPTSFYIPYNLGATLAAGESVEDAEAALKLLGKVEDRITSLKPDQRDLLAALISYHKGEHG